MRRWPLFVGVACLASAAQAGDKPLYGPVPAWVKPAPVVDAAKLDDTSPVVVVLDNQQRLADGTVTEYTEQAMRIASTQMQAQLGTLTLSWEPDKGDLTVHRVEIVRGAERIDLIAGKQPFEVLRREQNLERLALDGTLTATMQVEGLRVGDVLRVVQSSTHADKALKGRMQAYAPVTAAPFRAGFARSRFLWPADAAVKVKGFAEGLVLKPAALGSERELTVALPLAKQPEVPQDAPMRFQRPPLIEASTFADWADVSRTMAPSFATDGLIAPGSALTGEVDKIRTAQADPMRRAAAALRLVQDQIRYQAMGMNGGNYVPQPPAQTWTARYGDCKAKTLLLLAMLRALDIEAEAVLASSSLGGLVTERLPAPGAFDHVLVRARVAGRDLWLDGTANGTRLPDLGDTPPFRTVLPLRADGAAPMPLPPQPFARPTMSVDIRTDNRAGLDLPGLVDARLTVRGPHAEALRLAQSQVDAEQRRQLVATAVKPFVGEMQMSEATIAYDADAGTATVRAVGVATTVWRRDERRRVRTLDRFIDDMTFAPDRARATWRDLPVQTEGPESLAYHETYVLPGRGEGFVLEGAPTLSQTLAGTKVTRTAVLKGDVLTVDQRGDALGTEIAAADVPAARAAVTQAKAHPLRVLAPRDDGTRVQQVREARANGSLAALEAVYAKAIADDPEETTGYTSRASLRDGVFDYKGALADYTRLIELEPDAAAYMRRAYAWRTLGDDRKATADAEAALKLDPSSNDATGMLVSIRSEAGDSKGALALLEPRIEEGGEARSGWLIAKADALVLAKDPQGAVAVLDGAIADKPGNPALLNARCWTKATGNVALESALKDCTKAMELAEGSAAILDSRALVYLRMNRLEEAEADLESALAQSPDQSASLFLRGVVRKRAGKPGAAGDLETARLMAPTIDREYARWGIVP